MSLPAEFSRVERGLFIIALTFFIIIAAKMLSYIVSLFLMSFILTLLMLPAMFWLKKKGLSDFVAVLIITCAAVIIVLAFLFLTLLSFSTLVTDLPQYQDELDTRLQNISILLNSLGISLPTDGSFTINLNNLMNLGISGLMGLADAVMFLFFVGVTTFFMLLESPRLTLRMEAWFGKDSDTMRHMGKMTGYIIDFIVVRTETNFVHGVLFGGFLGIIGIHGAILWGILTFLLGYIPYFGLIIAAIPAIFFAWLQYGMPGVLIVIAAVCVLNLIVENPVYSFLAARKFEMPALIVILSVIFWGWLLGLVGMLFAIPITLLLLLIFELVNDLRWINVTLGVSHLFEDKGTAEDIRD
jgi:predicted PurR-regulated permease PerM